MSTKFHMSKVLSMESLQVDILPTEMHLVSYEIVGCIEVFPYLLLGIVH